MRFLKMLSLTAGIAFFGLAIAGYALMPFLGCTILGFSPLAALLILYSGAPQTALENGFFWLARKRAPVLSRTTEPTSTSLGVGIVLHAAFILGALCIGFAALSTMSSADLRNRDPPSWFLAAVFGGLAFGVICCFAAFVIHFSPNGSRRLKYNLTLTGFGLWKSAAYLMFVLAMDDRTGAAISMVIICGLDLTVLFGAFLVPAFLFSPSFPGQLHSGEPGPNTRYFFYLMHRFPVVLAFAFFCLPAVPFLPYLFTRYYLRERFRLTPILYLRSFGLQDAPVVFSSNVLREAGKFGVVVCLAHDAQKPYAMQERIHPLAYARMTVVRDELWQHWVEKELLRSCVVIIDVSMNTPGLTWELSRAQDLVAHDRVLVLRRSDCEVGPPGNLMEIVYSTSGDAQAALRRQLHEWLRPRFLGPAPTAQLMPAPGTLT